MSYARLLFLVSAAALLGACSRTPKTESKAAAEPAKPAYYRVDVATAGKIAGTVRLTGKRPPARSIDMDQDPACVSLHKGRHVADEAVEASAKGQLANAFVYLKDGLEGKAFEPPAEPVTIDQKGCWFRPRVIGIQTGQVLKVTNSDPVTHNIHPLAKTNREWNHSQGPEDPAITRRFVRPEVMIRVKCNIHGWMRAWVGVLDHPYFAVTGADGTFEIGNVPPGKYTLAAWQEELGTQEQSVTIAPSGRMEVDFTFKGE